MVPVERLRRIALSLRRAVLRRRRLLAALATLVAVLAGLRATAAPPPPSVGLTVVARDLGAGAVLGADDVTTVSVAPESVPSGHIRDPVGRVLAGPLRRGTPITDVALVGPSLVADRPDLVAMPVRLPDTATAGLLAVGDEIDLVAADPQGSAAEEVARSVLVLGLPPPPADATADGLPGRVVVLGVPTDDVGAVASASVSRFLTVTWAR